MSCTQRLEWRLEQHKTTSELHQMFAGGRKEATTESRICCDVHVYEETWGIATLLYGRCKRERRPHSFSIEAPQLVGGAKSVKESLHKNSKTSLFCINHQLCAAIQSMGCGGTDARTLAGFLDLSSSAKIDQHLAVVEKSLGPVQVEMQKVSEKDALAEEIEAMKDKDDLNYYEECTFDGHEHGKLPLTKTTYGNNKKKAL